LRAGLQLLAGVLIVAAIPIVSTVRILDASASRNQRGHADAALQTQLENGLRSLALRGEDASTRADELAQAPPVQRAFIRGDRAALGRLAAKEPGVQFFLGRRRVAGRAQPVALRRSVWLTVDGRRLGEVVATVPLGRHLARRLAGSTSRAPGDRLLFVRGGTVVGSGAKFVSEGRRVRLAKESFRAIQTFIPDARGVHLVALRPERAIEASIAPYRARVRLAAIGSFGLLVLVAIAFAGPILRMLGDFRRVASQATTDSLTGLANRRSFEEELALEWRRAERIGDSLALILLDLDNFKSVNDTHGHQAGDHVLRQVGAVLTSGVRQLDLPARYGGEEFVVLVPETEVGDAVRLAAPLRANLEKAHIELPNGQTLRVTASFGVAAKGELTGAEELVAAADEALYEAKHAGKNRVSAIGLTATELRSAAAPVERRRAPARKKAPAQKPLEAKSTARKKPTATKKPKPAAKRTEADSAHPA
jgi:diguanylate cyclase (GGDEF)-like protein